MPGYPKAIFALLAICLLPACMRDIPAVKPTSLEIPIETRVPTQTATPVATASPSPESTPLTSLEGTAYIFEINLDAEKGQADVIQRIQFSPPDAEIMLVVPPNRHPGVFTLEELRWGDGSDLQGAVLEGESLSFPLREGARLGDRQELLLRYRLDLPTGKGPLNDTGRQLNFGDWYPFLPVYREDSGWQVHNPAAVGEHLVYDLADYEVTLRLAKPDPKWVVAASAPAEPLGEGWHYSLPSARSFAFSASDRYALSATYVNGVQILSYSFPEHFSQSLTVMDATANAVSLFEQLYGEYPHSVLSVVEADFPDGLEYDGLYFLGESYYQQYQGNPLSYLVTIAVHETAHQWFYGIVGNDPALAPWLDEGLATYSEILFYEEFFPEIGVDEWWNFRGIPYPTNNGCVDGSIYDFSGFTAYVNCIYLDSAQFLMELRALIGDRDFFDFLYEYVESNRSKGAGRLSEPAVFFQTLRRYAGDELDSFIRGYFSIPVPVDFWEELNT